MKKYGFAIAGAVLAVSCGQNAPESGPRDMIAQVEPQSVLEGGSDGAPQNQFGFMEAKAQGPDPFGTSVRSARQVSQSTTPPVPQEPVESRSQDAEASDQQIAYSYGFGFQVEEDAIGPLQEAHVDLCAAMGNNCRVLRMSKANTGGWDGYGELELQVAADQATGFGADIEKPAADLDAELVSSVRSGEDLTEQIIDNEARLASRLVLRDKLTAILRNSRGSVDELVKAEKAVAEVNEEIDATRSKLKQFRNRIRFSAVRIEYEPYFGESQLGFSRPVMTAFRSIGTTLGVTISILIYGITALVPIVLLVLALRWILHRFGYRMRFWRKNGTRTQEAH